MRIQIAIGPDETEPEPGIAWGSRIDYSGEGWDTYEADGGAPEPDEGNPSTPAEWLDLAEANCRLPKKVRAAGLDWEDATVAPDGYSNGPGHAPHGITITWTLA